MPSEWIREIIGNNKKYKRETILNYVVNRWALNKAHSVDKVANLIRDCAPKSLKQWKEYYFSNAKQNKKNGIKINEEYITNLGKKAYFELINSVKPEIERITEKEFVDYMHNLVIERTYNGYIDEIGVIYGKLEKILNIKIERASDEWDRKYNVDYYIKIKNKYIGLQVKPIASGKSINDYQWEKMHSDAHSKFTQTFGGKVFFIYSKGKKDDKEIANSEIIEEIKKEIKLLS
jgi:hypothetical protein